VNVDVVLLPKYLEPRLLTGRTVVVFDVLRATTTMAAALAAGVEEIRIFGSIADAAAAAARHPGPRILCGEENCLPPAGFDLGNSPGAFQRDLHAGRTAYMSTTNGTRAIVAARGAKVVLTGALVNASAVARAAAAAGNDVTLVCAGTGGEVALEDLIGAGAVLGALRSHQPLRTDSDACLIAEHLYHAARTDLRTALTESRGGRNVIAAGLLPDIDFAARLDALDVAGIVENQTLSVRALHETRST
jgi:2-phosphosulfolactate phosphatase